MHLGIFAKTFPRPTLEETLDAVVDHGLTHVQFNMSCMGLPTLPDRIDEGSCVWIAQQFRERRLTMAAISGTFNMCDPSHSRLQNNLRRLEVLASACRWLDTRIITLCTGTRDPDDMWKWNRDNVRRSSWDDLVKVMKEAVRIADRHEVMLAFEPEIHNIVDSVSKARMLLDQVGSPWLKVVLDPANLLRPGEIVRIEEILDEAFDWLGAEVVLAHAKEPRIDQADEVALEKIKEEFIRRSLRAATQALVTEALAAEKDAGKLQGGLASLPDTSLLHEPTFYFYHPYFVGLGTINYTGAVIIHGLEEGDVDRRTSFLRRLLKTSPE